MKHIIILAFLLSSLFAFGENIQSFEADFVQTIIDEENKTLKYTGKIYSKRPSFVLWHYEEPVNKKIYIKGKRAIIVEPELEQVVIKNLRSEIDFFTILSKAQKIDNSHYKAHYKDIEFILQEENGVIKALSYTDQLENKVSIIFSSQKQNSTIDDDIFIAKVPTDFDIIKE